jgi:uncharacterized protein (UPF0548 family)
MFLARRPSRQAVERFIGESRDLPLSYGPIGLVLNLSETMRRDIDETVVAIGRGHADFERARIALARWMQFELGWVELFPRNAPIEPGTVLAVLIRHLGFWSLNGCRVVYGVGDRERGAHFGFAYGTLTNHAEAGEELFEVFLNPDTDEVTYRILVVSWPRAALTRVGYPITRLLQARFRRESAEAMKRATDGRGVKG